MTLKNVRYLDPGTNERHNWNYDQDKAHVVIPNDSPEFNLIHGVMRVDEKYNDLPRAWLYVEHFDQSLDIITDNWSVGKLDVQCSGNLVRNADFSSGYSFFWNFYGSARFNIVTLSNADNALEVTQRGIYEHGVYQDLYIGKGCFEAGDRLRVTARYGLKGPDGNELKCDRKQTSGRLRCADIKFHTYSPEGNNLPTVTRTAATAESGADNTEFALKFRHLLNWVSIYQDLDPRCIVGGQYFNITAKFKLLDGTDGVSPLSCDRNERNQNYPDHCPTV